ncbi:long-chain fatty acid--CoA ligase [Curtobacterium sp. MCBD17_028]|uniref:long-chain-fatty-acid--CoA ligase n=1 Tax=Curtobacterium sp. MCBD17_028 TaxID=2175670 RepID=UPI000DAA1F32|nr:long-chain fatty acid--CoA ligase [Curtobacterium sp. MCBD17_028]PZE24577.1 long-chain fatty acid--CoA ligase [Curtobacterium sp. MCBD17_028]
MPDPGLGTMNVAAIAAEGARRHRSKAAVITALPDGGTETLTYADLWERVRAIAGALRAQGVRPGDRVAVMLPNITEFPCVYFAVLAMGAVVVPVHLLFKRDEITHVLRDSEARVLVASASILPQAGPAARDVGAFVVAVGAASAAEVGADVTLAEFEGGADPIDEYVAVNPLEPATVLYTSGTTGTPKGAVGSHFALMEQVNVSLIDLFDLRQEDVVFGGLPLFHTFGQTVVMNTSLRRGATIVLLPRFDAATALDLCVRHRVTAFDGVPTMFIALLEAARDTTERPPLRFCISGGSALPEAVLERFEATFRAPIQEGYGMTETSPVIAVNPKGVPSRAGSVGLPIWGVDVVIADADVEDRIVPVAPGETGELVVRGHNLFAGYLGQPEATAAAMCDGWLRTGDIGTMSADGYVTIVDRKKDMIIRNGYNVYPSEVESVLHRHEDVTSAAVFGVHHDVHGQEVHAAVVLRDPDADVAAIDAFMRTRVAAFKYPRVFHVVDSLPLGPSGKVLRRALSATYSA